MLEATMPSLTALLTTKAEAWPVRVATHAMSHSHVTRDTPLLNCCGYAGVGMDDAERAVELMLVVWGRLQLAESHYALLHCLTHHQG